MAFNTELIQYVTSDDEPLHGLWFTPKEGGQQTDLAVLTVHGVAMNFYIGPQRAVAQRLADRGWHTLSINTRGHDWISRAGDFTAFGGSTYELFEDCLIDL